MVTNWASGDVAAGDGGGGGGLVVGSFVLGKTRLLGWQLNVMQ